MRAAVLMLVACVGAAAATTTITQTRITAADGKHLATGTITIAATAPFTASDGAHVDTAPLTVQVTNGAFTVSLEPNDTGVPAGTQYVATWQLAGAKARQDRWLVPATSTTLAVSDVLVSTMTLPAGWVVQWTQMGRGGATPGQVPVWNGASWAPGTVSGVGGGAGYWGTITGTLCDQADLCNALAGKAPFAHVHLVADVTGLQGALDAKAGLSHVHAIADVTGLQSGLNAKEATANKGQANGYAALDGSGKVPAIQLPSSSGMTAVVQDTAPQLGGDLDLNGHSVQTVTPTEMARVHGVTSAIQGQIDGKSPTGHLHTGVYEPVDATILRQANLAGSGAAATPARSDHNHTGTYQMPITGAPGTWPSTFPPVNGGDWAGTWQTHAPSYFQTTITGAPGTWPSTFGIATLTSGASDPVASCAAPSTSNIALYVQTTTQDLWICIATNSWKKTISTFNLGPYAVSGRSGPLATGAAGSRGACSTPGYYLATDTHALTACDGTNWGAALNPAGSVGCINNSTAGQFQCYDAAGALTTYVLPAPAPAALGGVVSGQCTATTGKLMGYDTSGNRICETDQTGGGGYTPPTTTKGDLFGFNTAPARVPVGADGQGLVADSTAALGVSYKARVVRVVGYEVGDGSAAVTTAQLTSGAVAINDAGAKTLTEASCISLVATQAVTVKIGATTLFSITCVLAANYSRATTDGTTGYIVAGSMGSTAVAAGAVLDLSGTGGTATDVKLFAYGSVN